MILELLIGGLLLIIIGITTAYFPTRGARNEINLHKQVGRSRISDLEEGEYVGLEGNISCDEPLISPLGKIECVYFNYVDSGRSSFKRMEKSVPFFLENPTGKILIDPKGKTPEASIMYEFRAPPTPEDKVEKAIDVAIEVAKDALDDKSHSYEKYFEDRGPDDSEIGLKVGQYLYVVGEVKKKDNSLVLTHPENSNKRFIITYRLKKNIVSSLRTGIYGWIMSAIMFIAVGVYLIFISG